MASYTQLNVQQIDHLAKLYDLTVDSYRPMEGGAANSSYLLETTQGTYVLTVYEDKSTTQVENMGKTLRHLARHDFPTAALVAATGGEAAVEYKCKPVLVKEYLKGRVMKKMEPGMLAQVGAALARLHQLPAPDHLSQKHPYGLEQFSTFLGLDIDPRYDAWLSQRLAYLEGNTPTDLHRALIHGDLFYDNVLFLDGKIRAIIDFEEACYYYKVFDLGMALLGICGLDGSLNLEKAKALIAGYLGGGELQETERNALQLMVETAAVATACWRFWKYNLHDPTPERAGKHWEMAGFADQVHAMPRDKFMAGVFES